MANANPSVTFVTQPFILSYPRVLVPAPYKDQVTGEIKGEPKYNFEGIADLDSLNSWNILEKGAGDFTTGNVEARLVQLAKKKWDDDPDFDVKAYVATGALAWPFKSGTKFADAKGESYEHYRGKKYFRANALAEIKGVPNAPALYFADKNKQLVKIAVGTEQGKKRVNELFYGGAICTAELSAVAGVSGVNKYVTFYINSLIYEAEGERLGGGSAVERLRGVSGGESSYDPTAKLADGGNLDEEIPF